MHEDDIPFFGVSQPELPEIKDVDPAIEGSGGDAHTNAVAILISEKTTEFEQAWTWISKWNKTCVPPWPEYRLKEKLTSAWNYVYPDILRTISPEEANRPRARRKKVSFKRLDEIAFTAKGKYDELLAFLAGHKVPPLEQVIDEMYPGNPILCWASGRQWWMRTGHREAIRGVEHQLEWLVPSPMSALRGTAMSGKENSVRCRDNAGPFRYMVIEFDFTEDFREHIDAWAKEGISTRDVQARLILWLALEGEPRAWPFMIVDSGKKSLHTWYAIHERFTEEDAMDLLSRAIPLGADKHADQPEQFFRFPGGTRKSDKSQPQPILYYDRNKLV